MLPLWAVRTRQAEASRGNGGRIGQGAEVPEWDSARHIGLRRVPTPRERSACHITGKQAAASAVQGRSVSPIRLWVTAKDPNELVRDSG